jgi:hypothetical protein
MVGGSFLADLFWIPPSPARCLIHAHKPLDFVQYTSQQMTTGAACGAARSSRGRRDYWVLTLTFRPRRVPVGHHAIVVYRDINGGLCEAVSHVLGNACHIGIF